MGPRWSKKCRTANCTEARSKAPTGRSWAGSLTEMDRTKAAEANGKRHPQAFLLSHIMTPFQRDRDKFLEGALLCDAVAMAVALERRENNSGSARKTDCTKIYRKESKQTICIIGVLTLAAKLCKADGHFSIEEEEEILSIIQMQC